MWILSSAAMAFRSAKLALNPSLRLRVPCPSSYDMDFRVVPASQKCLVTNEETCETIANVGEVELGMLHVDTHACIYDL